MFVSHSTEFKNSERDLSCRFTAFRLIGCLILAVLFGLTQFDVSKLFSQESPNPDSAIEVTDPPELLFFYDDASETDPASVAAIKTAVESGFRIREIAARRFPKLAERFKVRSFPALIMLRRDRMQARHDGRFTFPRIRQMFAKAREHRMERRENFREMLAGNFGRTRADAAPTLQGNNSGYVQTSSNSPASDMVVPTNVSNRIPKPLDRNGRFPVAHVPTAAEQVAFHATVRLRVVDPSGTSHGTGTIIHSKGNDALVLTCGHIFRESKGRGRVEGDVNFATGMQRVSGQLISYDADAHDIALIAIRTPKPIEAAPLAPRNSRFRLHQPVFTVGCDKANSPTIRRSHYKRLAIYDQVEKYDIYGRPIDGRSGGGLFDEQGRLIGVCNAAAVQVDEGIYSGLRTIYEQLTSSHLVQLFAPSAQGRDQLVSTSPSPAQKFSRSMTSEGGVITSGLNSNSRSGLGRSHVRIPPSDLAMNSGWKSVGSSQSPTARLRDSKSQNQFADLPKRAAGSPPTVPVVQVPIRDPESGVEVNTMISLSDLPADLAAKVKEVAAARLSNDASRIRALSPELKR